MANVLIKESLQRGLLVITPLPPPLTPPSWGGGLLPSHRKARKDPQAMDRLIGIDLSQNDSSRLWILLRIFKLVKGLDYDSRPWNIRV